jgi:hypothetical protein
VLGNESGSDSHCSVSAEREKLTLYLLRFYDGGL